AAQRRAAWAPARPRRLQCDGAPQSCGAHDAALLRPPQRDTEPAALVAVPLARREAGTGEQALDALARVLGADLGADLLAGGERQSLAAAAELHHVRLGGDEPHLDPVLLAVVE